METTMVDVPQLADEVEATYRFFANEKVTPELILSTHFVSTRKQCAEQSVVLLVQDTTEVDLTRPTSLVEGVGPQHGTHTGPENLPQTPALITLKEDVWYDEPLA
jgi:hypothetical protein